MVRLRRFKPVVPACHTAVCARRPTFRRRTGNRSPATAARLPRRRWPERPSRSPNQAKGYGCPSSAPVCGLKPKSRRQASMSASVILTSPDRRCLVESAQGPPPSVSFADRLGDCARSGICRDFRLTETQYAFSSLIRTTIVLRRIIRSNQTDQLSM